MNGDSTIALLDLATCVGGDIGDLAIRNTGTEGA